MSNFQTASSSGYRSILNELDRLAYVEDNEIIQEHRCNALIPQISDSSMFSQLRENPCASRVYFRHTPKGVDVAGLGRNDELVSTTPTQCVTSLDFTNYAYSMQKYSGLDRLDKCDFGRFMDDVSVKREWVFDDYIDRLGIKFITSVDSCSLECLNDCKINTGTSTNPVDVNKDNSHEILQYAQQFRFASCMPGDNMVMLWPRCEKMLLTTNTEFNDQFRHCCGLDAPQFTGEVPMVNNIEVMFTDWLPYELCPDGSRVYTIPFFPKGAFGYASLIALSERIETDTAITHFSFAERMILKFAMGIRDPRDFLNFKVKFNTPQLALTTCV